MSSSPDTACSHIVQNFPHFFNARARRKFKANSNAWSVNIKEKNYYYYSLGIKLAKLLNDKALPAMMRTILALRFNRIIDQAQNCIHEDTSVFRRQLTHCEAKLFQVPSRITHCRCASTDKCACTNSQIEIQSELQTIANANIRKHTCAITHKCTCTHTYS